MKKSKSLTSTSSQITLAEGLADALDNVTKRRANLAARVPDLTLGGDWNGTSLAGYLTANYAQLCELIGEPNAPGDNYKVSTQWVLKFRGQTYTIYDYKITKLYDRSSKLSVKKFRALRSYQWHVGSAGNAEEFIAVLSKALEGVSNGL